MESKDRNFLASMLKLTFNEKDSQTIEFPNYRQLEQ